MELSSDSEGEIKNVGQNSDLLSENLENLKSNQGMKFDAHVSNVGFILYLVARLFQSLRKQIRVLSHVFYFTFRIRT